MSFFLPKRLVDFEYFGGDITTDESYTKIAKPYQKDVDFAFFVVNFGYTKSDYEQLTPREIAFIYKAWEDKIVADNTHIRNAVMNAYVNARRKKNKKFIPLFKKKQLNVANKEVISANLNIVIETERIEGKSWVERIYAANNMTLKSGDK